MIHANMYSKLVQLSKRRRKAGKPLAASSQQRESVFQPEFREDLRYWVETDRKTALRILQLIEVIMRDPFQGIGKPEPLKFLGSGVWSRRPFFYFTFFL